MKANSFDTDESVVTYILEHLTDDEKTTITKENIVLVLDAMCNYLYDEGIINDEDNTTAGTDKEENNDMQDVEINEDDLLQVIFSHVNADRSAGNTISNIAIQRILDLEFEYGQSIGMYE